MCKKVCHLGWPGWHLIARIMQFPNSMPSLAPTDDAQLVAASLAGDRSAFAQIVERYQRLLCSLAYSATGRLNESEDVAQETFVTAWQQLGNLREPEKLRSWLCGILRHKASRLRRKDGREPARQADSIEEAHEVPSPDEPATHRAMKNEEQALMWHALEQVPELYREPLVLYYREHRSVEHVAVALDLTESTVKQRLSRGRKILQERVLSFVEGALVKSTPGAVFTAGVMASLATLAPPAKAAVVGAAAAQGGMAAKSIGLAPFLATISGFVSTVLAVRAGLDQSRTPRERRATVWIAINLSVTCVGLFGVLYLFLLGARHGWADATVLNFSSQALVVAFVFTYPWLLLSLLRKSRELRTAERWRVPEAFQDPQDQAGSTQGEYKSQWTLLGLPLVHIRFAQADVESKPVVAWIAGGDRAYGVLFAWGAWSVGFISIGAVSFGVISFGAVGIGVVGFGAIGVGLLALGSAAIGLNAYGSLSALGWETAQSYAFAIARTAAEGPFAFARHANDPVARAILENPDADLHTMIFLVVVTILAITPVALYAAEVRRRFGRKSPNT